VVQLLTNQFDHHQPKALNNQIGNEGVFNIDTALFCLRVFLVFCIDLEFGKTYILSHSGLK